MVLKAVGLDVLNVAEVLMTLRTRMCTRSQGVQIKAFMRHRSCIKTHADGNNVPS